MFGTVIAALDLSPEGDRSLPIAATLARQGDAKLLLATVHPIGAEAAFHAALDQRGTAVAGVESSSLLVESEHPAAALADLVSDPGVLACMATHHRDVVGQLSSDSTTLHVMRRSGSPVVITGPGVDVDEVRPVRAVTLCLDGSPSSDESIPVALALAEQLRVPVELLAVESIGFDGLGAGGRALEAHLDEVARRIGTEGAVVRRVVDRGRAAEQIVSFAAAEGPGTLLVLASHGLTGLARLIMGSVAAEVVRDGPCPVVVVPIAATRLEHSEH